MHFGNKLTMILTNKQETKKKPQRTLSAFFSSFLLINSSCCCSEVRDGQQDQRYIWVNYHPL